MIATKAAAAKRLMEIAFDFQRILLDYVHHDPETAAPSGESLKERYTRSEAEALAGEIQRLSHFFELRTKRGRADAKAKAVKFRREPILTPHQMAEAIETARQGQGTAAFDCEKLQRSRGDDFRADRVDAPAFHSRRHQEEAEEEAPCWAECYVPVRGGFFVFESEEVLQKWKATPVAKWPRVTAEGGLSRQPPRGRRMPVAFSRGSEWTPSARLFGSITII